MYQEMAEKAAREILDRGHQPLFVGGTGLYLRALRHPMAMGTVSGDEDLRSRLQLEADAPGGREKLHARLALVDPVTAARLPIGDVRRVIRALEVYQLTGIPFSQQPQIAQEPPFDYRVISLIMDRAILYDRIERRVDQMLDQGLLEEIRHLLQDGIPADCQAMKAIGYKELIPCLQGSVSLEEAIYELKKNTRHYAKRQLTWMRSEPDTLTVDALSADIFEQCAAYLTKEN